MRIHKIVEESILKKLYVQFIQNFTAARAARLYLMVRSDIDRAGHLGVQEAQFGLFCAFSVCVIRFSGCASGNVEVCDVLPNKITTSLRETTEASASKHFSISQNNVNYIILLIKIKLSYLDFYFSGIYWPSFLKLGHTRGLVYCRHICM